MTSSDFTDDPVKHGVRAARRDGPADAALLVNSVFFHTAVWRGWASSDPSTCHSTGSRVPSGQYCEDTGAQVLAGENDAGLRASATAKAVLP